MVFPLPPGPKLCEIPVVLIAPPPLDTIPPFSIQKKKMAPKSNPVGSTESEWPGLWRDFWGPPTLPRKWGPMFCKDAHGGYPPIQKSHKTRGDGGKEGGERGGRTWTGRGRTWNLGPPGPGIPRHPSLHQRFSPLSKKVCSCMYSLGSDQPKYEALKT